MSDREVPSGRHNIRYTQSHGSKSAPAYSNMKYMPLNQHNTPKYDEPYTMITK